MTLYRVFLILSVGLMLAVDANGQPRGERHSRSGRGDDPQRRLQRIEYMLGRLDANKNGSIEPDEVVGRRRHFFEQMAKGAGLDPSKPIPVSKIKEALAKRAEQSKTPSGRQASAKPGSSTAKPNPTSKPSTKPASTESKVPGFGAADEKPTVPGFGEQNAGASSAGRSTRPSSGASNYASSRAKAKKVESQVRNYAKSLLKRYDTNKNGRLERGEWKDIRGAAATADANRDGIITLDELQKRLLDYGKKDSSRSSSSSSSKSTSKSRSKRSSTGSRDSDSRRTYRFLSPTERLPEGLPDWFARKDADADGQVSMAEYASSWTDSTAAEFVKLDSNDDGLITPAECLAAQESKDN